MKILLRGKGGPLVPAVAEQLARIAAAVGVEDADRFRSV